MTHALYITYDGLTDPLGQSQVLPYLTGLAALGHDLTVLSCDKPDLYAARADEVRSQLEQWVSVPYRRTPRGFAQWGNLRRLKLEAAKMWAAQPFDLAHARSVLGANVAFALKKQFGTPVLYDMRGFWADERAEGGLWPQDKWRYRLLYRYYAAMERRYAQAADAVVVVTERAAEILAKDRGVAKQRIHVIPTCADTALFDPARLPENERAARRAQLNIPPDAFVILYAGSLGTWYALDELLAFFRTLLTYRPDAYFCLLTFSPPEDVYSAGPDLDPERLRIFGAERREMPGWLAAADLTISFVRPTFSKQASAPTKIGEYLSMGKPVIANAGVGDTAAIFDAHPCGACVQDFSEAEYRRVCTLLPQLMAAPPETYRATALTYFSLTKAVTDYDRIYGLLTAQ